MFTPGMLALRRAAGGGGVHTHLCTVSTGSNDYFNIYDVSDPTSPSLESSTALGNTGQADSNLQAVKDGYFYFADTDGQLHVYDVSDPSSPSRIYTLNGLDTGIVTTPTHVYTHPDYDWLIVQGTTNAAAIWDISDPTNMSQTDDDYVIGPVGVPTPDFTSYFSLQSNGTGLEKTPISSSGFGTSANESLSITSNGRSGIAWSVSPINGENYIWHGSVNYMAIIELGSDYTADSEVFVSDGTIWDRMRSMKSFDEYHTSTYESVVAAMSRDDDTLHIVGYNGTSFSSLVSDKPTGASLLGYGIDVTGYYVVSGDNAIDTFHIWEWDAETSLTLLSSTSNATTLDGVSMFAFYTP